MIHESILQSAPFSLARREGWKAANVSRKPKERVERVKFVRNGEMMSRKLLINNNTAGDTDGTDEDTDDDTPISNDEAVTNRILGGCGQSSP